MPKRKTSFATANLGSNIKAREEDGDFISEAAAAAAAKHLIRSIETKIAKDEHRLLKQKECTICMYVRIIAEMAAANLWKAQVLEDHAALALFTMPDETHLLEGAWNYLALYRQEEMAKLECRI